VLVVGKTYEITTWEGSEDGGMTTGHPGCEVIEFQFPVARLRQHGGKDWIVNLTSPAFASAKLED
jgi:hypothetical protein